MLFRSIPARCLSPSPSLALTPSRKTHSTRTCARASTSIDVPLSPRVDRKEFGLDSFISPTLLSNMREKDLTKAISYHLKKIQSLMEPGQKVGPEGKREAGGGRRLGGVGVNGCLMDEFLRRFPTF